MIIKIREVTEQSEIIKAFSHLYTDRSRVLLWQTSKSDNKKKTLIYCELVSIDNNKIYLTPFNTTIKEFLNKKINSKNKIFIRGTVNGVLFKSENYIIRGDQLEIPMPNKILLSENRRMERHRVNENSYLYIKLDNESLKKGHQRTTHKIQDFGKRGFSVQMSKHDSHHYEINKSYKLTSILGESIPSGYEACLVYLKVHSYIKNTRTQVVFKAGFRLNKDLPHDIFDKLMLNTYSQDAA